MSSSKPPTPQIQIRKFAVNFGELISFLSMTQEYSLTARSNPRCRRFTERGYCVKLYNSLIPAGIYNNTGCGKRTVARN